MKDFWIGTGWKMNKTATEARDYIATLLPLLPRMPEDAAAFVVPPFTALSAVRETLGTTRSILVGAQNMHWEEEGSFTGEISARMLKDAGVDMVELGHSERRQHFGETDEAINRKVRSALAHGLTPLICVGDSAAERDAGASAEAIIRQIRMAFFGLTAPEIGRCLIAYEPIWAIGDTGVPAEPEHIVVVHRRVKAMLAELSDHKVPLLYGGSVNAGNIRSLAGISEIDGLFIGRAAWQATEFARLIAAALSARANRREPKSRSVLPDEASGCRVNDGIE